MQAELPARVVLITGASGNVGRVLADGLEQRYSLILSDSCPQPGIDRPVSRADASDIQMMRELCAGVDTVIPLAISGRLNADWNAVAPVNITGVWTALQAAVEMGCRRVILPSTILLHFGSTTPYTASKLWAEQLGRQYAERTHLSVIALRIGRVSTVEDPVFSLRDERLKRILTHRDLVGLVTAAIEAPDELRFGVYWGISANRRSLVDMVETRRALGFVPQDDAYRIAWRGFLHPRRIFGTAKRKIRKWKSR